MVPEAPSLRSVRRSRKPKAADKPSCAAWPDLAHTPRPGRRGPGDSRHARAARPPTPPRGHPGAALWLGLWAGVGHTAGNRITTLYTRVDHCSTHLLAALGMLVIALTVRVGLRRRRT